MKDIDRTDKYLSYYSFLRKTVKWLNVHARLCTLQCIFVHKTQTKSMYKNFLHEVARSWIAEVQNPNRSSSDELQWPEKQPTVRGPNRHQPGRLYRDFSKNKLDKTDVGGEAK
jgi:hypothetical protein